MRGESLVLPIFNNILIFREVFILFFPIVFFGPYIPAIAVCTWLILVNFSVIGVFWCWVAWHLSVLVANLFNFSINISNIFRRFCWTLTFFVLNIIEKSIVLSPFSVYVLVACDIHGGKPSNFSKAFIPLWSIFNLVLVLFVRKTFVFSWKL